MIRVLESFQLAKRSHKSSCLLDRAGLNPARYAPLDRVEFREGSEVLLARGIKNEDAVPATVQLLLWAAQAYRLLE